VRRVAFVLIAVLAACSNENESRKKTPTDTPDGGSTKFSFKPASCAYTIAPPERYAFAEFALDDAAGPTEAPQRVRLGLGGGTTSGQPGYADPSTSAVLTWETPNASKAAKVKLGLSPGALDQTFTGFSWTTPPPEIGFGNNEPATYMHEVHVCGLQPGKTYYYQVGGGSPETWSATQSFTTVPDGGKIVVGVSGDARDRVETWQLVNQRMLDASASIHVFSGDVIDIGGLASLYRTWLDAIWKDPKDPSKFLTLGQQMFVTIAGNHENEAARFYANFAIPGEGDYAETYASFNVGSTHFVMIDDQPLATAETSDHAKAILTWLEQDLARANADRAKHPFIVAVGHRAVYSTSLHAQDGDVLTTRRLLAPIFDKHKVDLVFNGHDHEYERSKPLKPAADPAAAPVVVATPAEGTTYVVCAGAGAEPYAVGKYAAAYKELGAGFGQGTPYAGVYCLLTLEGQKLTLKGYGMKAAGGGVAGDDVLDTFELTK
jgi:hypothetical protein